MSEDTDRLELKAELTLERALVRALADMLVECLNRGLPRFLEVKIALGVQEIVKGKSSAEQLARVVEMLPSEGREKLWDLLRNGRKVCMRCGADESCMCDPALDI